MSGESRRDFSPFSSKLASFPGRYAGVWVEGGMSQSAWPAQSFRQTRAENSRGVKPISQSKLNTQRNEPADVISSYPFRPKGISPLPLPSGSVFRQLPLSDHCTLSTFGTLRSARDWPNPRCVSPSRHLAISPFPRQKTIAQGRENSLTFPQLELNTCRFNRKSSLTVISPPLASLSTESILRMLQSDECEFFFLSCSSKRGNFLSREVLPALNPKAPKYVESLHRSFLSFFLSFLFFFFFLRRVRVEYIYIYLFIENNARSRGMNRKKRESPRIFRGLGRNLRTVMRHWLWDTKKGWKRETGKLERRAGVDEEKKKKRRKGKKERRRKKDKMGHDTPLTWLLPRK